MNNRSQTSSEASAADSTCDNIPKLSYEELFYKPVTSGKRSAPSTPTAPDSGVVVDKDAVQPVVDIKKQTARILGWLADVPQPVFEQMITSMSEVSKTLGDHWLASYATKIRDDLLKLREICIREVDQSKPSPLEEAVRGEVVNAIQEIRQTNENRLTTLLTSHNENVKALKNEYNKVYQTARQMLHDINPTPITKQYIGELYSMTNTVAEVRKEMEAIMEEKSTANYDRLVDTIETNYGQMITEVDELYTLLVNVDSKLLTAGQGLAKIGSAPALSQSQPMAITAP